jgi:hypothetical protein
MRILTKSLILMFAVAGVATLGLAGPAHASSVDCAQQQLRADTPNILIVTCTEAEGDQRRGLSTVINNTDQAIQLTELVSLISFPEYGTTDCGPSRLQPVMLQPGTQLACSSPWVLAARPWNVTHAAAFTLLRVTEAQGRYTTLSVPVYTYY